MTYYKLSTNIIGYPVLFESLEEVYDELKILFDEGLEEFCQIEMVELDEKTYEHLPIHKVMSQ